MHVQEWINRTKKKSNDKKIKNLDSGADTVTILCISDDSFPGLTNQGKIFINAYKIIYIQLPFKLSSNFITRWKDKHSKFLRLDFKKMLQ